MSKANILEIRNLYANINDTNIINGLNLSIKRGEIHAIMGKNGSGKSTLAKLIAGHPSYNITDGHLIFNNKDITTKSPEIRAHEGIFLAFQYPVEIPGVANTDFLRLAYNSQQKVCMKETLDPLSFFNVLNKKIQLLDIDINFIKRNVNEGFSGGEKKKNEILQMALLEHKLAILDEIDSGVDIDALKTISDNINRIQNNQQAIIIITHYQRILEYIKPDFIHIMDKGKIVHTGNAELATKLEKYGYDYITSNVK